MASSIRSVQPIQPLEVPQHSLEDFSTEGHEHNGEGEAEASNSPDENGEEEAEEDDESVSGISRKIVFEMTHNVRRTLRS